MCPHRRTREGGERKCSCCSDTFILGHVHEWQMKKLCRKYKNGFHAARLLDIPLCLK